MSFHRTFCFVALTMVSILSKTEAATPVEKPSPFIAKTVLGPGPAGENLLRPQPGDPMRRVLSGRTHPSCAATQTIPRRDAVFNRMWN